MDNDRLLQRYPSPDGKRWVELRQRPDGLFYFQEFYEAIDTIPVYGTETYPSPGWQSGVYQTQDLAERDLKQTVPWLCAKAQ